MFSCETVPRPADGEEPEDQMPLVRRRLLAASTMLAAGFVVTPAVASAAPLPEPPVAADCWRTASMLDGFVVGHVPRGLGSLRTDFEYEWEEVVFHSRVWETGPDAEGHYRVDLTVKTLRGGGLTSLRAVRAFLTEYYEHDPEQWPLRRVKVGRYDGYRAGDQVFWFVSPGVAAAVTLDLDRFPESELSATARGFRPACDGPIPPA
jgi:hypothetical protein